MVMFSKILIANRGEIACRIIDTARRMGIKTVAVFSDADVKARHVLMADEAVHIGPAPVVDSYLKGDVIIKAALKTGAEAIHPGYGFLSENPDFVDAVDAADITFIGPSSKAIRAMGLKDAAKMLMSEAGVPVVPGYHGSNQDPEFLHAEAEKIGFPVLIKARAGGGGKGMRLVETSDDFNSALESAAREGQAAFGDPVVLIEKFITSPRHIEVQIFGDGFGNVVHLYERDCSLQRRHQKVIEEAPAPGIGDEMRASMTSAAVKAAKAIGYESAGTIEFIVDGSNMLRSDGFWFMEMNTRLQVEHPVTEAITGLDLVELQLRVAAGDSLPFKQDEVQVNGHAFEARLYAEDVSSGFLPASGNLAHVEFSDMARNDTGIGSGDDITPYYDPMIAKVITHGSTRNEALNKLSGALSETHIAGTISNLSFLQALAHNVDFVDGNVDTGLIERNLDALIMQAEPNNTVVAIAMITALKLNFCDPDTGWRLWGSASHLVTMFSQAKQYVYRLVLLEQNRINLQSVDDERTVVQLDVISHDDKGITVFVDGIQFCAKTACFERGHEKHVSVLIDGQTFEFVLPDPLASADAEAQSANAIVAPMSGVVRLVEATNGAYVKSGERLIVIEAMKMEMSLTAPCDGKINEINCCEGDAVEGGTVLLTIEDEN